MYHLELGTHRISSFFRLAERIVRTEMAGKVGWDNVNGIVLMSSWHSGRCRSNGILGFLSCLITQEAPFMT